MGMAIVVREWGKRKQWQMKKQSLSWIELRQWRMCRSQLSDLEKGCDAPYLQGTLPTGKVMPPIIHSWPKTGHVSQHCLSWPEYSFKVREVIHFGVSVIICKTKPKQEYTFKMYNVYLHPSFKMRKNCLKSINLRSTADNHHHQCTNSRTTFCVSWKLWLNVVTVRRVQNQRKLQPSPLLGSKRGSFSRPEPTCITFSRLGPDQIKSNFKFQNWSLLDVG